MSFNVYDSSNLIELNSDNSSVIISKFGAHVISWKIDGNELLWISNASVMDGTCPIRGGIPICFPQFADNGPLKLHGFARETMWTVIDTTQTKAILELKESSTTKVVWNNDFILRLTIEILESSLVMTMDVTNPSNEIPLEFSTCFHTYFKVIIIYNYIYIQAVTNNVTITYRL
jgi:glucose-6-phosphate 1-epimerase